jgi:hypothetical protein
MAGLAKVSCLLPRQLQAIEAGKPFEELREHLQAHSGTVRVKVIDAFHTQLIMGCYLKRAIDVRTEVCWTASGRLDSPNGC